MFDITCFRQTTVSLLDHTCSFRLLGHNSRSILKVILLVGMAVQIENYFVLRRNVLTIWTVINTYPGSQNVRTIHTNSYGMCPNGLPFEEWFITLGLNHRTNSFLFFFILGRNEQTIWKVFFSWVEQVHLSLQKWKFKKWNILIKGCTLWRQRDEVNQFHPQSYICYRWLLVNSVDLTCFLLKSLSAFSYPSSSRVNAMFTSTVHQIWTLQRATCAGGSKIQTSRGLSSYEMTASFISCRIVSFIVSSNRFNQTSTFQHTDTITMRHQDCVQMSQIK